MAIYRVRLYREDLTLQAEEEHIFDDDDAVIGHIGNYSHPHFIEIWDDERLVTRIPPQDRS